ncbi:hypothetical protein MN608_07491 [Microdochium nivale]|nr:hypothetical protein MN608_07491 [Microdochium nivale]
MSGPFFVGSIQVAVPPPEGYVVDFNNPQRNLAIDAYWHFGIGNAIALLAIAQRIYVRLYIQKKVLLEDAFLGAAYVFSVVTQSLAVRDIARGIYGTHIWEMPIEKFSMFVTSLYTLAALYNPVHGCVKLSLLIIYNRLTPELWFRYPVWITIFVVATSAAVLEFLLIFPCYPVTASWGITDTKAACVDRQALYMASAIMGATTDALVLAVPMPLLWKLQRPRREKIGLAAIFCMGIVTVFTAVMRLKTTIESMGNVDLSWGSADVMPWIFAEANLSIICGSLLTIKTFLSQVAPGLLASSRSGSRNTPGGRQSIPGQLEIVTIGGSGGGVRNSSKKSKARRDKYERFDDESMYPLATLVDIQATREEHGSGASLPADKTPGDASDGSVNDAESTRGIVAASEQQTIVMTKTTVVSYQNR